MMVSNAATDGSFNEYLKSAELSQFHPRHYEREPYVVQYRNLTALCLSPQERRELSSYNVDLCPYLKLRGRNVPHKVIIEAVDRGFNLDHFAIYMIYNASWKSFMAGASIDSTHIS